MPQRHSASTGLGGHQPCEPRPLHAAQPLLLWALTAEMTPAARVPTPSSAPRAAGDDGLHSHCHWLPCCGQDRPFLSLWTGAALTKGKQSQVGGQQRRVWDQQRCGWAPRCSPGPLSPSSGACSCLASCGPGGWLSEVLGYRPLRDLHFGRGQGRRDSVGTWWGAVQGGARRVELSPHLPVSWEDGRRREPRLGWHPEAGR